MSNLNVERVLSVHHWNDTLFSFKTTRNAGLRFENGQFVMIGLEISALDFGDDGEQRNDPLRMIEAVTAGVAFLAAGLIFTSKGEVQNVTTGASLWLVGAIGLGCGAGQMPLAAMATVIVIVVLFALRQIETWMGTH